MQKHRSVPTAMLFFMFLAPVASLSAQQYPATFDYANLMNTYFDDRSGLISFQEARVIFAPEDQFNGKIAVLDKNNTVISSFDFYKDYKVKNGVFARVLAKTPADVTLTKPGVYSIVYLVDGKPATRLPFQLKQSSAGSDPFNPVKTYQFDGYWRSFAYINLDKSWKGDAYPEVFFWLGGVDLPDGKDRDGRMASLFRDGKLVAHSKRTQGIIRKGHFKEDKSTFYHPHDAGKEVNAIPFLLKDWLVDGVYELRINRMSDKVALRSYDFKVAEGKIEQHPRSILGYQPRVDFIAPRIQKKGGSSLEMTEVFWIEDRKL